MSRHSAARPVWERRKESGDTTASTALKRLAGYSGKNHFYRANRELGRVFKTKYIIGWDNILFHGEYVLNRNLVRP